MNSNTGCIVFVALLLLSFFVGGIMVQYCIESWVSWARHEPVDVNYWLCAVIALPFTSLALPATVVTWIISMAIDDPESHEA